ncbi:MAG: MFS transporter [Lachnospiraceae bacterium]|nr:MFS transporter [Lachnospiraceae bacterium]
MKLDYKRTVLVGFAFFLICAFWQAYDNIIPLILTNKFGMRQTYSGIIMALDNILALFMLPLFGAISDRCKHRMGKRTPFILTGTIVAAAALIGLGFLDGAQLQHLDAIKGLDDRQALEAIYDDASAKTLMTPDGETYVLGERYSRDEFLQIRCEITDDSGKTVKNPEYVAYVVPAREAYANTATMAHAGTLILFILVLLIILFSMATFRSPAVALMPDVTVKPLRSKANAVINLMGSAGGILILGLGMVFSTSHVRNALMAYLPYFLVIAAIMLGALLVFMLFVKEVPWAQEMREESLRLGIEESGEEDASGSRHLSAAERRSLIFILISIVLWFFGYNAVTSKYSVYATNILQKDYNLTLIIAQAAAILSYLPVGFIASRVGRKKTILAGVVMLAVAFLAAAFMNSDSPTLLMNAMFALAGIAWATINVNSFPMVVELATGSNIGRYTGFYYTASMAAQVATPMLSGLLMDLFGMRVLFPYATAFVALAFVTMLLVKHGDSRPQPKKGLEALEDLDN